MLRGGAFNNNQNNAACANRNNNNPHNRNNNYGVRVVVGPIPFFPFSERQSRSKPTVAGVYGFQPAAKAEG